jgi:hypothetical protein
LILLGLGISIMDHDRDKAMKEWRKGRENSGNVEKRKLPKNWKDMTPEQYTDYLRSASHGHL